VQLSVERIGATKAKVSFNVPAADFAADVRTRLNEAAGKANMKGFRPGKVPPQVIEKQFGEQVRLDSKKHFLEQALQRAVEEQKLKPAAWPRVAPADLALGQSGELAHSFDLLLRPDIELGNYLGLEVEARAVEVSEAEIDAALADLRRQQSRLEAAGDAGLPADGMALAKVELVSGERTVASRDGMRFSPKTPPAGVDAAAFESALVGAREGEKRELAMRFPDDFEPAELRGQDGQLRIELKQVYRVVPPSDEELFKLVQVADEAAMRAKAGEHLRAAKQLQEQQRQENALLDQVLAAHPVELPAELIEDQARARLDARANQLAQQGAPQATIAQLIESEREQAKQASQRGLHGMYLIEAIAAKEKLQIADADLVAEVRQIAQRNNASFEQVRDHYQKNNLVNQLAMELLERRVRSLLRERARLRPAAG
jgi:trigger factor